MTDNAIDYSAINETYCHDKYIEINEVFCYDIYSSPNEAYCHDKYSVMNSHQRGIWKDACQN